MQEKILELIVFILSEIKHDKQLRDIDVPSLTRQGFTHAEITSAYNWVFDHFMPGASIPDSYGHDRPVSHRILHNAERLTISTEAQGYLLQLRELEIITEEELEFIIERIMMTDLFDATVSDITSLVAAVLFETDDRIKPPSQLFGNSTETVH